jgi:mono/diheme cytochrome c family protein
MISTKHRLFGVIGLLLSCLVPESALSGRGPGPDGERERLAAGKELFTREWLPGDKRSHAGDGLGPVFNARSCAACHHQGGVGGAGPRGSNARVVSAFVDFSRPNDWGVIMLRGVSDREEPTPTVPHKQPDRNKLAEIHPALGSEGSFPLHRFSTDKAFQEWKSQKLRVNSLDTPGLASERIVGFGFAGGGSGFGRGAGAVKPRDSGGNEKGGTKKDEDVRVVLIQSERNTPGLFGSGLIDNIPDRVLKEVAAEQEKFAASPSQPGEMANRGTSPRVSGVGSRSGDGPLPVSGRVSILKDGRIGRFGWKANVSTLREFTLQACSSELGLEVPGFPRAAPPWIKDYKAPGLDLTADQCDDLVQYVASLPRPIIRTPETAQHAAEITEGRALFAKIGCASCHRPKLGAVEGIYSDLLLHDMGQSLSGTGFYGTNLEVVSAAEHVEPLPASGASSEGSAKEKPPKFGAGAREWRTPPLWGLRASAPYLHDGRAETITAAIEMHDGEGSLAVHSFSKLTLKERMEIELFLESLAAPPSLP